MKKRRYKQGIYKVKNPSKYLGSATSKEATAIYRSSWEHVAFQYLDSAPNILKWGSELVVIPYHFRLDVVGKMRRYYMDLYFEDKLGQHLIEIKPKGKADFNKIKKTKNERYISEYIQNIDKWNAASIYAKERGMTFQIWTEDHIKEIKNRIILYK